MLVEDINVRCDTLHMAFRICHLADIGHVQALQSAVGRIESYVKVLEDKVDTMSKSALKK